MFISPLLLIDTKFITAPLAVDSTKKVTTTSIVLPLELTKTSIMSWVPAYCSNITQSCMHQLAITCKDTCVNVCLTYGSIGQGRPSSISSSYGDRVVVIFLQLSEREDYDIMCYDVEGKVIVSASTGLSSVEVSYKHQVTSTHWSRLQGMHMCIITFYT